MRRPKYLSPTSISLFYQNQEDYYIRYLTDYKIPRPPQTQPMSIGSAFDAQVKSHLHARLFGEGANPAYELQTLFEAQVEPHNRDWAWTNGEHAFKLYKESGALADLLIDLNKAVGDPIFEVKLEGIVRGKQSDTGVNLLGYPDIYFLNKNGVPVIIDWKVNGWCSRSGVSPKRGYMKMRHGSKDRSKDKDLHKNCIPMVVDGMMINVELTLDEVEKGWGAQTTIYAWLCGADVGSPFIAGIDQLACQPSGGEFPEVRIAEHRLQVNKDFQWELYYKAVHMWEVIQSDHIFRDVTIEESKARCEALDAKAKLTYDLIHSDDPEDQAFLDICS